MNIGQRIKSRRKELGISAEELGSKLGKDRSTIYRYEKGEIENLPLDILEPIADILETTPAYLMGWEEAKAESLASITLAMFDDDELRSCVEAIVELKKHDPDSFNIISDLVEKLRKK